MASFQTFIKFAHSWHLFGHSLKFDARKWGPAVPTNMWSSFLRPSSAHWDLGPTVEVWQCPLTGPRLDLHLACLLAGWLAGWLACLLAALLACLPACLPACLLACLPACLLAALLPWHTSLRELSREKKSTGRKKKNPRKNGVPHNYGQYIRIKSLLGCQFLAKPSGTSGSLSDSIQQRSSKPELRECTVINTMVTWGPEDMFVG